MDAIIQAIETSNPARYVEQKEAYEYFCSRFDLTPKEKRMYRQILLEGPIRGRYIGVEHDKYERQLTQDDLIAAFTKEGRLMALQAAKKALTSAHCTKIDVAAIIVNTCTGYLCPGLSSYLVEDLGLPNSTAAFDLMGMGCGAAIPNLRCASKLLTGKKSVVVSVAVEVCSATFFRSADPGCIVSNCIFGDGAAAAIVGASSDSNNGCVLLVDFESGVFTKYREELRYVSDGGQLRNVLSSRVPVIGAKTVSAAAERLLKRQGLHVDDIHFWAIHPGGTMVLEQVGKKLGLKKKALSFSQKIFQRYGNMSSPSVLFVLKSILDEGRAKPGQLCLALSFGAGFSSHVMLCEII